MKLLLLTLASVTAFGQVSIAYSRQHDAIPRAYVGKPLPKGLFVYRAQACNTSPQEARFFPDRVAFDATRYGTVQDARAVIYAATQSKNTSTLAVVLDVGITAIPLAGTGLAVAKAFGVDVPNIAAGIGAAAGVLPLLKTRKEEVTRLEIPPNWLTDSLPARVYQPGQCEAFLLALGGDPPENFTVDGGRVVSRETRSEHPGAIYDSDGVLDVKATIIAANMWAAGLI